MKMVDAKYSVKVGYWALKNKMKEYKVYAIKIRMFDPNFVNKLRQAPGDNSWPSKSMNRVNQYSLVKASCKKWPENESDLDDDEYELPILKYDAN